MTAVFEPHEAQTFHRAAVRADITNRIFEPRTQYEGFGWYDNIPRIREVTPRITTAGVTQSLPTISRTTAQNRTPIARPDAISLHVLIEHPDGKYSSFDLPADLILAAEPDAYLENVTPLRHHTTTTRRPS